MAAAPQTPTALRDLSSSCAICLVSSSAPCPRHLNLIKLFTLTIQPLMSPAVVVELLVLPR